MWGPGLGDPTLPPMGIPDPFEFFWHHLDTIRTLLRSGNRDSHLMSSCGTRIHIFLWQKKTCLLQVFLSHEKKCRLVAH